MDWTGRLYTQTFAETHHPHGQFSLRENDYCFGNMKFGKRFYFDISCFEDSCLKSYRREFFRNMNFWNFRW